MDKQFFCTECEAQFSVVHDEILSPRYCCFCGERFNEQITETTDHEWDGEENTGC